ncbi:MAG TPA: 2-dehydropantoate 2-reductase [Gemmatimonadales bacterium]
MKHAILGAGGVGGLIGAVLAHAGHDVILLLRPETSRIHPDSLSLESPLGKITAPVSRAIALESDVDVLWATVKATQLGAALAAVPPARVGVVVPLLNGVDHMAVLRERFGQRVVAGTFAGEAERVAPGRIVHNSPWARFVFHASGKSALEPAAQALTSFGCNVAFDDNEATMLWKKLVILAPFALTTTGLGGPIGEVRESAEWRPRLLACAREACQVARGSGATVDEAAILKAFDTFPAGMRSSMQKDVAAGRPPEVDAIAGPILRGAAKLGIKSLVTAELAARVAGLARSPAG